MVSLSLLAAGAAIGVGHAVEPDHIAAVMTLVDGDTEKASLVGVSWALGHSLSIVSLGLLLLTLGIRLPASVTQLFEVIVGLVLIALGARVLRRSSGTVLHRHEHGSGAHQHLQFGGLSIGLTHLHIYGNSFFVGVVHGVAGSGSLVILIVSTTPSVGPALSFLGAFSLFSMVTMAAVSFLWGLSLHSSFVAHLERTAGRFSVVMGVLLLASHLVTAGIP